MSLISPALLSPLEVELLAYEAGISMKEVYRQAGIAYSTFWRWRTGRSEPTIAVYRRICDALFAAAREPGRAA